MELGTQSEADLALERKFTRVGGGIFRAYRALVSMDNVADAASMSSVPSLSLVERCAYCSPSGSFRVLASKRRK